MCSDPNAIEEVNPISHSESNLNLNFKLVPNLNPNDKSNPAGNFENVVIIKIIFLKASLRHLFKIILSNSKSKFDHSDRIGTTQKKLYK